MTSILMLRLPINILTEEIIKALTVPYKMEFKATKSHLIITWCMEESENYDRFGMDDGHRWMSRLVPLRDELLHGDLRSLYIGWLASLNTEMMGDDAMEPITVIGLNKLTAAQKALAEFLEVDMDLLAGVGMDCPAISEAEILPQDMDKWIDALPRDKVNSILKQLIEGKGLQAERSIKIRFAAWKRDQMTVKTCTPRRTVGMLLQNAEKTRQARLEKQKRARKLQAIKRRKTREAYLENMSTDFSKAWASVRGLIQRGSGRSYDEACGAIVDIAEAYALFATKEQFQIEFKKIMADHMRRKALIQRLMKAGVWME